MPKSAKAKRKARSPGVEGDWGKTRRFWCPTCGMGFHSPQVTREHCVTSRHMNEEDRIGFKPLTIKQQIQAFRVRNT